MVLRGYYDGKAIILDGPADLPRNQPLAIDVRPLESDRTKPAEQPKSALKWMAENAVDDPSLPPDLSVNLDHYLYGAPKQEP